MRSGGGTIAAPGRGKTSEKPARPMMAFANQNGNPTSGRQRNPAGISGIKSSRTCPAETAGEPAENGRQAEGGRNRIQCEPGRHQETQAAAAEAESRIQKRNAETAAGERSRQATRRQAETVTAGSRSRTAGRQQETVTVTQNPQVTQKSENLTQNGRQNGRNLWQNGMPER